MPDGNRRGAGPEKKVQKASVLRNHYERISAFRFRELSVVTGGRAVEIVTTLAAMAWVERSCGQAGLGIYSYVCSLYLIAAQLSEWGLPHYLERETALRSESRSGPDAVLLDAFRAVLMLGALAAVLLVASSAYDTAHTRIEEKMGAYLLAALALPLRNLNHLRLALLNGLGRHEEAAKMRVTKHLVFLAAIWVLLGLKVQPSYLIGSFLLAELYLAMAGRRKQKLPPFRAAFARLSSLRGAVQEGSRFVFTDDPIGTILYVDMLILGFFISSWDLGAYAEASALARLFLLIPAGVLPVLRRKFCVLAAQGDRLGASLAAHQTAARLFALHALLAIYMVYFFPGALHLFFKPAGEELLSFRVFEIFLPGLLFAVSAMALEPLYEAVGKADSLRKLMGTVLGVNFLLNVYLIPVAGLIGAALATTLSMLLCFLLLCWGLERPYRGNMGIYLLAGGGAYLVCGMVLSLGAGAMVSASLFPILFGGMLYMIGFFDEEAIAVQYEKGGKGCGRREEIDRPQA